VKIVSTLKEGTNFWMPWWWRLVVVMRAGLRSQSPNLDVGLRIYNIGGMLWTCDLAKNHMSYKLPSSFSLIVVVIAVIRDLTWGCCTLGQL